MLKAKQIICIEGNIGAGKSYLLAALKDKFQTGKNVLFGPEVLFAPEPVEHFKEALLNGRLYSPLKNYYDDPHRYAFSSQLWFLECYKRQLEQLAKTSTANSIVIMDRGIYSTTIFVKCAYNQGLLQDFEKDFLLHVTENIIRDYFGENKFGVDKLYYLNTPVQRCKERIEERKRFEEESMTSPRNYLRSLGELYDAYVKEFREQKGRNQVEVFFDENVNEILRNFILFMDRFET